jgi:hypothetical protein
MNVSYLCAALQLDPRRGASPSLRIFLPPLLLPLRQLLLLAGKVPVVEGHLLLFHDNVVQALVQELQVLLQRGGHMQVQPVKVPLSTCPTRRCTFIGPAIKGIVVAAAVDQQWDSTNGDSKGVKRSP